jgi:hypothetical protein
MLVSATPVAAVQFSRQLFCRVMVVTIRRTRFFHPRGQKLQIKKIGRLDRWSAHDVHLLERQKEANANTSAFQSTFQVRVAPAFAIAPEID